MEEKDQDKTYDEEGTSSESNNSDEDFGLPDVSSEPVRRQPPPDESQSKYKASQKSNSDSSVIVGIILFLVIAGLAAYYFLVYVPGQEQLANEGTNTYVVEEVDQPIVEEPEPVVETPVEPTEGQVTTVNSRTGRAYVIIGSFFDGDLAMDYGKKLASQGLNTKIIEPYNNKHFYRLSIQDFDSMNEAQSNAETLKSQFGDQIWVLKY